jgi:hypothetical protein
MFSPFSSYLQFLIKDKASSWALVAQAYNSSFLGGRDQEDSS